MSGLAKLKPYIRQIRGISFKPDEISETPFEDSVPLLKANNITDDGLNADSLVHIHRSKIKSEQFIRAGDLLLAASSGSKKVIGKSAYFSQPFTGSFGAFCKLVRPQNGLHTEYLKHFFKTPYYRSTIERAVQGANINNLKNEHLDELEILLPDIDDQTRITHLLGKVEGLIAQRKQHLRKLDDLLKSVFLEIFGDPVKNDRQWKTRPFSKIGRFISGGTPSKSRDDYWAGEYPWVSPKDMKTPRIFDSEDHISEKVFEETSLKRIAPGHLLIVVRGMILAHSFPVAINMVDVAINQDMKAIKVDDCLRVDYVYHCLSALKRQILKLITTAGHGTKKFDSDVMDKLLVPVPPPEMQSDFISIADKVEVLKSRYQQSLTDLEALYGALSQQAFKGELDMSRVALPAAPIEGEKPAAAAMPTPITTPVIELPETNLLLPALSDRTHLAPLLRFWLEAYRMQLGSAAFSLEHFIAAAQARLAELHPDHDFALSASDYEAIKAWVFDEIQNRKLKQTRDIICIDGRRQFGNQILVRARRPAQQ